MVIVMNIEKEYNVVSKCMIVQCTCFMLLVLIVMIIYILYENLMYCIPVIPALVYVGYILKRTFEILNHLRKKRNK